jgi:hypothetical protein
MMGISALALGLCPAAFGQGAPTTMEKPAKTTWQKYPDAAKPAMPKLPSAASAPALPSGGEPGSRVIVYNKPANEIQAVQAVDPKPAVPMPLPKVPPTDVPKLPNENQPKLNMSTNTADNEEKDRNVFRLLNDTELSTEVGAYIDKVNDNDYKKKLDDFNKNPSGFKPTPSKKVVTTELKYLDTKTPSQAMPVTKANYAPKFATLEPGYVVHRKLYFEDQNSERYGWDLGMAQPAVSTLYFFKDVLIWPHKLASNMHTRYDVSAGKCPPGSPVAYYLYPPELSFGGGVIGTTAVLGTIFLLP